MGNYFTSNYIERIAQEFNRRIVQDVVYKITKLNVVTQDSSASTPQKCEAIQVPHCRVRSIRNTDPMIDGPGAKGVLFTYEEWDDFSRAYVCVTIRIRESMKDLQKQCEGTNQAGPAPPMEPVGRQFSRGIIDLGTSPPW
jgi:hypothetical protein